MGIVYFVFSMTFQNCLAGAITGFTTAGLVEAGVILAVGVTPPGWIAVGGLIAGTTIGCLVCNYFCNNPAQPVVSNELSTIIQEDEAQFQDVVRSLYALQNAIANAVNNISSFEAGLKYDLLQILYLNYNDYYAYIQSVENYQEYVANQFLNSLQPFLKNFILSAQAYAITLQNLAQLGQMSITLNGATINANISSVSPLVVFFNNTQIPAGFGVQLNINGSTNNIVYLFGDPTATYQAVLYDQNGNPVNQFSITFNDAVVEEVPLGLATVLPYLIISKNITPPTSIDQLYVQVSNDGAVTLDETADYDSSWNPNFTNVAILLNITEGTINDLIFESPSSVTNYLSLQAIVQYYQYLQNLNLVSYANYLWEYYHNNGVTQQQLYQILNGIVYNINIPQCNPSVMVNEAGILFTILNDLALQNQTTQISIYPVFAYGIFNIEGIGQVSGYVQFNEPTVLVPGSCTKVGGFIVTQNNQLYVIPPGQVMCNSGNYTVVFRPDIYIINNNCYFVPVPNNVAGVNNPPQNSVGIILDLNEEMIFNQGQQYSQQGWYVNSVLDSGDTIDEISFTPSQTFAYVPSQLGYLVLNNQGLQTTEQQTTPVPPSPSGTNPILILLLALIGGVMLGLLVRYAKHHK